MRARVELRASLADVDPESWNALDSGDDPFIEHAFLRALEASGSVGEGTGWLPRHVTIWHESRLVGALPLYVKRHSYGEYIFDWSWAAAAERAGIRYYPKLVSMVPFTPATGTRLLCARDVPRKEVTRAVLEGVFAARDEVDASSVHLLFLREDELALVRAAGPFAPRVSTQFHWRNEGDASFDAFLGRFRSALRKQVRRERRRVDESGLEVRVVEGPELGDAEWNALREFYFDTCLRRGSGPYLTARFFDELRRTHASRVVAVLARRDGRIVAGTLNFQKGRHLYGRHWGACEDHPGLHFELCYYRLIERAIAQGLDRFEAGAQGVHKLRRGLMPAPVYSAHWIAHPELAHAVTDFLAREGRAVREEHASLARHGPFHRQSVL